MQYAPRRRSASIDWSKALPPSAWMALGFVGAAVAARAVVRRATRLDLSDRVVLITGGSRGLGLVMARRFAAEGARVAICGRDAWALDQALGQLREISETVYAYVSDVTKAYDVKALVSRVSDEVGPIDVLVNNVATIQIGPMQGMNEGDYQTALDAIFWSTYRMTEAVVPSMRARGGGRIANIASIGGLLPAPHLAPYVTAKHALVGYSRSLHNALAREGIRVTTVNPGLMRTGSPRNVDVKGNARAEYAWFKLADSLPLTSMSADRAGRAIVEAIAHGDAELTLTLSAKLGARVQSLFPKLSAAFGSTLERAMPSDASDQTVKGHEAESAATRSVFARLTDRAAERNNELA